MRRLLAIGTALALTAALASTSLAVGPARVNRVVGNFTLVDYDGLTVGRVVVDFTEPTLAKPVPGSLDVTWAPYDPAGPAPFPFMALDWPPVEESHAQLLGSWFGREEGPDGISTVGGADGWLCDYTGPWNAGCRPFSVQFRHEADGSVVVSWFVATEPTGNPLDHPVWYRIGTGTFVLAFARQTGS